MAPDERLLRAHLAGGAFRAGEVCGRWQLVGLTWPYLTVIVAAASRPDSPKEFALRFECAGYPNVAPTGGIWDLDSDISLSAAARPKGARAAQLFRTDSWQGGATAMYAAWDRIGLQAHPDWAEKYPRLAWNPKRTIVFILDNVHEVLNADDYLGT
ncbi:MAG: hypothetical protein JWR37_5700 [Mycobacterium sp.]|nr:hypothetical protein [Mycobacterium sp.]